MAKLTDHFTEDEMACPTTGEIVFERDFLKHLEDLRIAYARPMVVTSGCRTDGHNDWLIRRGYQASPSSLHLIKNKKYGTDCCAIDIARPNGHDFADLVGCALEHGWSIGIAKTFIHLDMRTAYARLPQIIYTY